MYFCYQDNLNIARKGLETIEYCLQEKLSSAMQGKMKQCWTNILQVRSAVLTHVV